MRNSILFAIFASQIAQAKTVTVVMKSLSYDPKQIELKVGDSVEWENKSYTEHSATADDGGNFDTGMVKPKQSSQKIKMNTPGTIHYHCSLHGKTMSGSVTVNP